MSSANGQGQGSPGVGSGKQPDLIPREFLRVIAVWSIIPAYMLAGAFLGWLVDSWLKWSFPFGIALGLIVALIMAVRDVLRLRETF